MLKPSRVYDVLLREDSEETFGGASYHGWKIRASSHVLTHLCFVWFRFDCLTFFLCFDLSTTSTNIHVLLPSLS
jgi:hypothetical protein